MADSACATGPDSTLNPRESWTRAHWGTPASSRTGPSFSASAPGKNMIPVYGCRRRDSPAIVRASPGSVATTTFANRGGRSPSRSRVCTAIREPWKPVSPSRRERTASRISAPRASRRTCSSVSCTRYRAREASGGPTMTAMPRLSLACRRISSIGLATGEASEAFRSEEDSATSTGGAVSAVSGPRQSKSPLLVLTISLPPDTASPRA